MKKELKIELNKETIDKIKMNSFIVNGRAYKFLGFISMGYESIGLFKNYDGKNIFHHLAKKGVLELLLPQFFGPKSSDILAREGISESKLVELLNFPDLKGFTPAHYAVLHEPLALQTLIKFGVVLTSENLESIFSSEKTAKSFFTATIYSGFTDIFLALCKGHPKIQKDFISYLPHIIEEVRRINTINSFKVFDTIFENYWINLLVDDKSTLIKAMRLFKVLNETNPKDQDIEKAVFKVSLSDWSNLLSKNEAQQDFTSHNEVKKNILNKFAYAFLNETLQSMKLSDLMNEEAIGRKKFLALQQFVEQDNLQIETSSDNVAQLPNYDMGVSASGSAQTTDSNKEDNCSVSSVNLEELIVIKQAMASSIIDEKIRQLTTEPINESIGKLIDAGVLKTTASAQISIPQQEDGYLINITEVTGVSSEYSAVASSYSPSSSSIFLILPPVLKANTKRSDAKKKVTIQEYADKVVDVILNSTNCMIQINKDLGGKSIPLFMFISIIALPEDFFEKVLNNAAKKLEATPKTTNVFLQEYISTVESDVFLHINTNSTLNAYGLACARDQLDIAKLLLVRGLELGVYSANTESIFELPIKFNSSNILQYLFTEQKAIKTNWQPILLKALKYANVETIKYYATSKEVAIEVATDKKGNSNVDKKKYNILNKALDYLVELSQLQRFDKKEQMDDVIKKIPELCECIEIMIINNKIFYAVDNQIIAKKTFLLLKELHVAIKELPNNKLKDGQSLDALSKTMNKVKNLVIEKYKAQDNLPMHSKIAIDKIDDVIEDDTASQATFASTFSVLSGVGEKGNNPHVGTSSTQAGESYATISTTIDQDALLGNITTDVHADK